jgi:hypothetical protein
MSAAEKQNIIAEINRHHERKEHHKCCLLGLMTISVLVTALACLFALYLKS